jgi:hypothetical protein
LLTTWIALCRAFPDVLQGAAGFLRFFAIGLKRSRRGVQASLGITAARRLSCAGRCGRYGNEMRLIHLATSVTIARKAAKEKPARASFGGKPQEEAR